ncbi:hypothetical protein BD413DRAFT_171315 [Trametes elegans]|nr:hypothetical protein BD413DRAFT_171315 [Trametes elegans]
MHATTSTVFALFCASVVLGAPTASIDAKTFLQNGKDAQALNAEFAKLHASDSCTSGQLACLGTSLATCADGKWKTEACPESLSCFALPSVRENGTELTCTTNATALAVINASGATGGVASNSTDNTVDFPTEGDCSDDDGATDGQTTQSSNSTSTASGARGTSAAASNSTSSTVSGSSVAANATASASGTNSAAAPTVTVTVTAAPESTLSVETTTLDRSAASSFLSSIATDSNFSAVTTVRGSAPASATASASGSAPASATATASASEGASESTSSALSSKPVGIASAPSGGRVSFTSDIGAPMTITLRSGGHSSSAAASSSASAAPTASASVIGLAADAGAGSPY